MGLHPDLLEDAGFRLAFVCSLAGGRQDPRELTPMDPTPTPLAIKQQLTPMMQGSLEAPLLDSQAQCERLRGQLEGVAARLLNWSPAEREFLDRLHDMGEVDAALLHADPTVQQRIRSQPMLLWKAQNVRQHANGTS